MAMCFAQKFDRERVLQRSRLRVQCILSYCVAPLVGVDTAFRKLKGKEDGDEAEGDTRIESLRKKIIVSHPPTEVEAPHEPLEDATDEDPRQNIWSINGRDAVRCDQCNGDVDVAPGEDTDGQGNRGLHLSGRDSRRE